MSDLDTHLPLKAVDFHILLVLTDGDRHGYGIVKDIEQRSDGHIRLEPGNLYRYVRRLVDADLIAPAERRPTGADERRRYYRVTELGRRVLAAEVSRMRSLIRVAEAGLAQTAGEDQNRCTGGLP